MNRTDRAILECPPPHGIRGVYALFWDVETEAYRLGRGSERNLIMQRLAWRDGFGCFYCLTSIPQGKVTIDHYVPRSFGGSDYLENLRLCCQPCNARKGSLIPTDEPHTHVWPQGAGPARCFRCPVIRPAIQPPPVSATPSPRATPKPPPARSRPAMSTPLPPTVKRPVGPPAGTRISMQEHAQFREAKIARLEQLLAAQPAHLAAPTWRQSLDRLLHQEASRAATGRRRGKTKAQARARWLDDGGALHPEWDDDR